jgi:hypothetical protein
VSGLYEGRLIYEIDTGNTVRWNATDSLWRVITNSRYIEYTPTWRGSAVLSIGNGTLTGLYRQIGEHVDFQISVLRGSTTNVGITSYTFDLPVQAATFVDNPGVGNLLIAGNAIHCFAYLPNSTSVALNRATDNARIGNASYAWAAGDRISIRGSYRTLLVN